MYMYVHIHIMCIYMYTCMDVIDCHCTFPLTKVHSPYPGVHGTWHCVQDWQWDQQHTATASYSDIYIMLVDISGY